MKVNKIAKSLKTSAALSIACGALTWMPTANSAVINPFLPIATGPALSEYWTYPRLFKQYFDWRSSAGWGTIGATNVAITLASHGSNDGSFTKALFSDLCGTVAAGLVAKWKPASDPAAAANMKAIVKGGITAAASSACGWATELGISVMNKEIPRAQNAINSARNSNQPNYNEIVYDVANVNVYQNNMEKNYRDLGQANRKARISMDEYRRANCTSRTMNQNCQYRFDEYRRYTAVATQALADMNKNGEIMNRHLQELGRDVKS